MSSRPPPAVPRPMALAAAPHVLVARPALGLTLYLGDPAAWARSGAAALFDVFRRLPQVKLNWYTTSQLTDWFRVDGNRLDQISGALSGWLGRPRHLLQTRVVDDPGAASIAFAYREVDLRLARTAPTLEILLPPDRDPAQLLALASQAATLGPILFGIGGYVASWNPHEKPTAFWEIHGWCKRYLGLDVQDADATAWRILDGIPGTNWLTLIGPALADRLKLDLGRLEAGPWGPGIVAKSLPHALLLRAGELPVLGDLNRAEFPSSYAEVARRLAPLFVAEPAGYWGGFYENEDTVKWLRRLVEPESWQ
jgi:hypothetical protein